VRGFFKAVFYVLLILSLFSIANSLYRLSRSNSDDDIDSANIGVIEIEGVILDSLPVLDQIHEFKKNSQLKSLVVRINSPGGAVGASQEIYLELKKLRKIRPVIVSMGDLAASGGLYVSMGGDIVMALPGTLTGSMGVLMEITNFSRLLEKIYVDPVTIRSGELKDAGNPTHPIDPRAKKLFQELVSNTFQTFRETVKKERKLNKEAVQLLSDGRVVDGTQALQLKLVDELGTFPDAVELAKTKGKISGEPKLAYLSRKPKPFLERLVQGAISPVTEMIMKRENAILQYRWDPRSK